MCASAAAPRTVCCNGPARRRRASSARASSRCERIGEEPRPHAAGAERCHGPARDAEAAHGPAARSGADAGGRGGPPRSVLRHHAQRMAEVADALARELGFSDQERAHARSRREPRQHRQDHDPAGAADEDGAADGGRARSCCRSTWTTASSCSKGLQFEGPVLDIIAQKQERPDGHGYPRGLAGGARDARGPGPRGGQRVRRAGERPCLPARHAGSRRRSTN